ncbi:MAG: SDR family oxidoreductase [Candidatus Hydrogenedentes bacterium]|nr:SDR family oxidoreductase [Candidatus Hydrogenedentota bacterium]
MRYLVTGGGGFIGSNIVHRLLAEGHEVTVLDDFSSGRRENLEDVKESIRLIEGDLRDSKVLQEALRGQDYCLHQGAVPSVPRSIADPWTTHDVNVNGTLRLLETARDTDISRIVIASSSSVYGDTPTLPKREDMTPRPISPYAVSKMVCEHYASVWTATFGVPVICLRYFNVFGPRQDPTSQYSAVIPLFVSAILNGKPPTIFGDGQTSRDFCYVENVVAANLCACTAPEEACGQAFNIACGERTTLNELVSEINQLLGTNIEPNYGPDRPGDVKHSLADIGKARELLGYDPQYNFAQGLKLAIDWYRADAAK